MASFLRKRAYVCAYMHHGFCGCLVHPKRLFVQALHSSKGVHGSVCQHQICIPHSTNLSRIWFVYWQRNQGMSFCEKLNDAPRDCEWKMGVNKTHRENTILCCFRPCVVFFPWCPFSNMLLHAAPPPPQQQQVSYQVFCIGQHKHAAITAVVLLGYVWCVQGPAARVHLLVQGVGVLVRHPLCQCLDQWLIETLHQEYRGSVLGGYFSHVCMCARVHVCMYHACT